MEQYAAGASVEPGRTPAPKANGPAQKPDGAVV